ncbi:MAG TPA: asparagine synthase (glutamine-hydrolyzing) [Bryobacteraceae bacterium]|jgi:asparagine synthase (glutamine-hydrolysing)
MCGINGLFYLDPARRVDTVVVDRMCAVAGHRGPDDHGVYLRGNVGLGFNRLSVIDLSGGRQPMANEDETVWIVFNGEIYNFESLHYDLAGRGHRFRTHSDTEAIVHAWEEYGERCVEKLRGMFAFAIWDERRRLLFAARDRLGIKPLYYFADDVQFAFASELKSLLEVRGVPREIDPAALGEYLRRRYVIAPNTILKGIRKLQPGHSITVTAEGCTVKKYWDVPLDPPVEIGDAEAIAKTGAILEESLRLHLVSDVPLGAFLSGGLDSSCVVALMAKLGVANIRTFSLGYDSPESELSYARIVADRFRTDHHELRLTPDCFRDTLPKIVWHMDEPVGDPASIPLYYLSAFARRYVKVALSGEGSDELFGGYPIYRRMLGFERVNRLPLVTPAGRVLTAVAGDTKVRKYAEMLGRPLEWRYGGVGGLFSETQTQRLYLAAGASPDSVAAAYRTCGHLPPLSRMSYVDIKTWLADDLLVKADRMSMAHSLELRVPFLDHHVVEFAARLPERLKIRGGVTKYLVKKWAEPLLPREIIYRPKKGFPVPVKSWFRGDLSGFAREILLDSGGIARDFLSPHEVERLLRMHSREDRSEQIYSLIVLDHWRREFMQPSLHSRSTSIPA